MIKFHGKLRIYTGDGAKDHPEWCDYEENIWVRESDHIAELAAKDEVIAVAKKALEKIEHGSNDELAYHTAREALAKIEEMEK